MESKKDTTYHFYVFEIREKGNTVRDAVSSLKKQMKGVYNMSTISERDCIGEDFVDGDIFFVFRKQRHSTHNSIQKTIKGLEKASVNFDYVQV